MCSCYYMVWHACEGRNLYAVTPVCGTFDQMVEKNNRVIPFPYRYGIVLNAIVSGGKIGQFVIVGGEEGLDSTTVFFCQFFGDGPGNGQTIIG